MTIAIKDQQMTYNLGSYLPINNPLITNTHLRIPIGIALADQALNLLEERLSNGHIGVDMIQIRVHLDPDSFTPMNYLSKRCAYELKFDDAPKVMIGIDPHDFSLALRFNPSQYVWSQGKQICPFREVREITEKVLFKVIKQVDPDIRLICQIDTATGEVLETLPKWWRDTVMVTTLHLSSDIGTHGTQFDLQQFAGRVPKNFSKALIYTNKAGEFETITHVGKKKSCRHSLYNKYQERIQNPRIEAPIVSEGTFRYEVQIPRWQLNRRGLGSLGKINENVLLEQIRKEWDNSRMGEDLVWEGEMISLIQDCGLLPERTDQLIGYASAFEVGCENQEYSEAEVASIIKDLKLVRYDWGRPLKRQGAPYGRLSIEAGCLINPTTYKYRISRKK